MEESIWQLFKWLLKILIIPNLVEKRDSVSEVVIEFTMSAKYGFIHPKMIYFITIKTN